MGSAQGLVYDHNNDLRSVRYENSLSFRDLLHNVSDNILINGGKKNKRRECLLEFIVKTRTENNKSIVIFSDDDILEEKVIALAQNSSINIGEVFVFNEKFPHYDFFCGMENNFICEYFEHLASERGSRDTSELNSYADAFISILSNSSAVKLSTMQKFARNNDNSIVRASNNVFDSDLLTSSPQGGRNFRNLLNKTCRAFSSLTTEDCNTGDCIRNKINDDCIIFVNVPNDKHKFYSIYFAMELESLMDQSFVCVFDDSVMLNHEIMQSVINIMKQQQQMTVVASYENIISIDEDEKMLKNFHRNLLLLNGNTPYADLQRIMSTFGEYTHMDLSSTTSTQPNVLINVVKGKNEGIITYSRDRVILQEEFGNEALFVDGSNPLITIIRNLKT